MKVFCDTSVLVAACVARHPHFSRARPVLESVALGQDEGSISCHSLAEVYSVLTLLPLSPRILPGEAERIIEASIRRSFRLLPVSAAMYEAAIATCVRLGLPGGKVYDALLLECARKANCRRIYTFNTSDLLRLAPDLSSIIVAPELSCDGARASGPRPLAGADPYIFMTRVAPDLTRSLHAPA